MKRRHRRGQQHVSAGRQSDQKTPVGAPRLRPKLTMLGREDCLRIHRASCAILQHSGVDVLNDEARDTLRREGAFVSGDRVKIPPSMVEAALATVPGPFDLYYRGSDEVAIRLDGEEVVFGPGSDTFRYLNPRTGQRHNFNLADLIDCYRLCDALPEIGFLMSIGVPRDVPQDRYFRHQFAAMLRNSTKPIVIVCDSLADLEHIVGMAAAAAGGLDRLSARPNILLYSEPTSPLQHSDVATAKLLFCAKNAIPITHSPAPMMGGTAPISLAGAVSMGNAEVLSSIVMHQLTRPGAPFLYGHGVHHLDMKSMISVYGAPEFQLARVMAAEMGRFYGMPVWGYAGHSDSKVVDGQAAADAQFSVMVALMSKTNLNHDVGYLESGLSGSPEMILLTSELISMNKRFMEGVALDEEALAVSVVQEVGPGGEFLSHDHTLAHWRELWLPEMFDRQRIEPWEEQGSPILNSRLREKAVSLMDTHRAPSLPDSVEREIERLLSV